MLPPDAIATIAWLRDLNAPARHVLAAGGTRRRFVAGAMLWNAGDEPRGLHVVLEGEVRVVRIVGTRQHVVHTEGPGGTLGDVPLFDGSTYPATAVAASAVVCAVFSREVLEQAIGADPRLAFALLSRLAGRVRHVIDRLDSANTQTVGQRLAQHLHRRLEGGHGPVVAIGGTQTDVAEELGTVREVLVRELRDLRDAGVIGPAGRGRWRVLDAGRLRRRAGFPAARPARNDAET